MSPSPSQTEAGHDSPTSQSPRVSPLFMAPQSSTSPEQPPQPSSTSPSPSPDLSADQPWSTDEPSGPSDPGPDESSATPSTSGAGVKLSKAGLRAGIGTGFRQVCKLLASALATEDERDLGVWQPDDDDVQDVAIPATNIVYRRLPDEAKGGDVIDLMALGLAVAGYVGKNLMRRQQIRKARELQQAQGIDLTPDEGAL
ncbi:hypothetical protein [Streptomyces griseoaurantiacus]|uniref:hypothetical protein n=1 Tax=Streptomyces griseoaurantiacus TaxID=68213 RepID=UPI0030E4C414